MSSTGRGAQRKDYDKYFTPTWLVDAFFDAWKEHNPELHVHWSSVLEPACGSGAIVEALRYHLSRSSILFSDIAPEESFDAPKIDFMSMPAYPGFDLIMTNPPYTLAEDFVMHGLKLLNDVTTSRLVLLLRINFFGGQARYSWLSKHMPDCAYVTPRRPNFVGKGTDSTEYAWFVWKKEPAEYTKVYLMDTRSERYK